MPDSLKAGLLSIAAVIVFAVGMWAGGTIAYNNSAATIGGTRVPTVHCTEDSVISWTGVDTLDCVHIEAVR